MASDCSRVNQTYTHASDCQWTSFGYLSLWLWPRVGTHVTTHSVRTRPNSLVSPSDQLYLQFASNTSKSAWPCRDKVRWKVDGWFVDNTIKVIPHHTSISQSKAHVDRIYWKRWWRTEYLPDFDPIAHLSALVLPHSTTPSPNPV